MFRCYLSVCTGLKLSIPKQCVWNILYFEKYSICDPVGMSYSDVNPCVNCLKIRCAQLLLDALEGSSPSNGSEFSVVEVGCGAGGGSFELSKSVGEHMLHVVTRSRRA